MHRRLILFLLLTIGSYPALHAQGVIDDKMRDNTLKFYAEYIRKTPTGCDDPVTTLQQNVCAAYAFKQADSLMQTAFKRAYEFLSKSGSKKGQSDIVLQQRLWIDHRNGHCDLVSKPNEGAALYQVILIQCMTALTQERIKELNMIDAQK